MTAATTTPAAIGVLILFFGGCVDQSGLEREPAGVRLASALHLFPHASAFAGRGTLLGNCTTPDWAALHPDQVERTWGVLVAWEAAVDPEVGGDPALGVTDGALMFGLQPPEDVGGVLIAAPWGGSSGISCQGEETSSSAYFLLESFNPLDDRVSSNTALDAWIAQANENGIEAAVDLDASISCAEGDASLPPCSP